MPTLRISVFVMVAIGVALIGADGTEGALVELDAAQLARIEGGCPLRDCKVYNGWEDWQGGGKIYTSRQAKSCVDTQSDNEGSIDCGPYTTSVRDLDSQVPECSTGVGDWTPTAGSASGESDTVVLCVCN